MSKSKPSTGRRSKPTSIPEKRLEAALGYAKRGWAVFPLDGKRPYAGSHGHHDATTRRKQIREWWKEHPEANVGIRCCSVNGPIVVDIDGPDGKKKLAELERRFGKLPPTLEATSGRKHRKHLYFEADGEDLKRTIKICGASLDILGDGGYVVAPPSIHPETNKPYRWLNRRTVAPLPETIREMVNLAKQDEFSLEGRLLPDIIPEGQRDKTMTSIAGSARRRGASEEGILALIRVENARRCDPPLPDKQLQKIARSIGSKPVRDHERPQHLGSVAFHGIAGEIVEILGPRSEADPIALLIQFLVMVGNVIGPGAYFMVGGALHYLNEFALIIGNTSSARKGQSLSDVKQFFGLSRDGFDTSFNLEDPVESWAYRCVKAGLSTGEGLIEAARRLKEQEEPRLTNIETEFGKSLSVMRREASTLSAVLRQAWDGTRLGLMTRNKPISVEGVLVSVIGHITESELRKKVDSVDLVNGFANRFLAVYVERSKLLPSPDPVPERDLNRLRNKLSAILRKGVKAGELKRTKAAEKRWEEIYLEVESARGDSISDAATARPSAHILRLSGIYAILDGKRQVHPEHLEAALAVWRYAEASWRYVLGGDKRSANADVNKANEALRKAGAQGLSRTEIKRDVFDNNRSTSQLNAIREALEEAGWAVVRREKTGGKPVERWYATGS